jgi:hypothetical protein
VRAYRYQNPRHVLPKVIFLFGNIIVKTFSLGVYLMQLSIFYVLQTQKQPQQQRNLQRQVNISL